MQTQSKRRSKSVPACEEQTKCPKCQLTHYHTGAQVSSELGQWKSLCVDLNTQQPRNLKYKTHRLLQHLFKNQPFICSMPATPTDTWFSTSATIQVFYNGTHANTA